eukprot:SAG31_NODE_4005_length_3672_cov_2.293031_4_plen_28_part_01
MIVLVVLLGVSWAARCMHSRAARAAAAA